MIKKDSCGFRTVKYNSRDSSTANPYVYPASVTHVFFMDDNSNPEWKIVLRHDVRSRRIVGETDVTEFRAPGSANHLVGGISCSDYPTVQGIEDEVQLEQYLNLAAEEEDVLDEAHLDNTQFVDEVKLEYQE